MSDWPQRPARTSNDGGYVSTASILGPLNVTAFAGAGWPSANLAIFVPFSLPEPRTVYKMMAGSGTTAAGNFDLGIYDRFGNRLVSGGATAKTASTEMVVDITDTYLGPGLYYMAMSADGTNNYVLLTPSGTSPVPLQKARAYGTLEAATAYVLPATVTFAARTFAPIPLIAAMFRSY